MTEADELNDKTFGSARTVATFTTPLAAPPRLTLVESDGTPLDTSLWRLYLKEGGTVLTFGAARGTVVLFK